MKLLFITALSLFQIFGQTNAKDHYIRFIQNDESKHCTVTSRETIRDFRGYKDNENPLLVRSKPVIKSPVDAHVILPSRGIEHVFEIFGRDEAMIKSQMNHFCKVVEDLQALKLVKGAKEPEIVKIIDGGDQENRIDVVFMGDGYTLDERQKFFDDMERLTTDMFQGDTFKSYLPVFNIWAIFVESEDSGIGYDGPLNTPFSLYREAGQLRAIYTGDANYARQVCRLTGTGGCDYPSLIGNDDFYGGLGGEFVISTKSNRTGTVVLRHEMGHNFVDVGEEYDNGYVYSGVNAAYSVASLGWSHWLSGEKKEERAIFRLKEYPWKDLSEGGVEFSFRSDGSYHRWYILVSVSAAGEDDSLEFLLDGEVLPWTSTGFDDREFYSWSGNEGLASGQHTFAVRSKTASTHPKIPRMICSINLHEFGNEEEFHMDNNYVSAYPTFSYIGAKTFRPTNAGCLMRNMTHAQFCPVCREGMWYQFLERISIIDDIVFENNGPDAPTSVTLQTLKLGQLRPPAQQIPGETLEITWSRNGEEQVSYKDQFTISAESGNWNVQVKFVTPEIRNDPNGLTIATRSFTV